MKKLLFTLICVALVSQAKADRVYILPGTGFNVCSTDISTAISNNGHTVNIGSSSQTTLPGGFTSSMTDPTNGYDWLLLFGTNDYSGIHSQVINFINSGGKVLYQYEMFTTGTNANVASLASQLTGLSISVNSTTQIASLNSATVAWEGTNIGGCKTLYGNGYRAMDGIPAENRLLATSNLNNSSPSYTVNPAFGFFFKTSDFTGGSNMGALIALGDANIWYEGLGTAQFGGVADPDVIDFFFPNSSSTCFLIGEGPAGVGLNENDISTMINAYPNPTNGETTFTLGKVYNSISVSVINNLGQIVQQANYGSTDHVELELGVTPGIYTVKIAADNNTSGYVRIVKK